MDIIEMYSRNSHSKVMNVVMAAALCIIAVACGRDKELDAAMDRAESMMNAHPDSALRILETHRPAPGASKAILGRHSLLTAMARDKNFIDDTTFQYLQPAIDYYIDGDHGNPDDRLRAFFYQGRLYSNRNERVKAMRSYQMGHSLKDAVTDSLTLANLLYEQSKIYYSAHRIVEYCQNNKEASLIYNKMGNVDYEIDCLNYMGDAAIVMNDRRLCDSIADVLTERIHDHPEFSKKALHTILGCRVESAENADIEPVLMEFEKYADVNDKIRMELAYGYYKIGKPHESAKYIECITDTVLKSYMQYQQVRGQTFRTLGRDKEAAESLTELNNTLVEWLNLLVANDLSFADVHYDLEMESRKNAEARKRTTVILVASVIVLGLVILLISLRLKNRSLRALAEKSENERLEIENMRIKGEKENLELAGKNAELELERERLANKNLELELAALREERDTLVEMRESAYKLPLAMDKAVRDRVEALDNLIAYRMSSNKDFESEYRKWLDGIMADTESCIHENRLSISSRYPELIRTLRDAELTESEIDYVCLLALGLSGKEIGNFLKDSRHYHRNSIIRRKLHLDEQRTTLAKFVRSFIGKK